MDPLIFIAIIVVFSILDSIARKNKKRTGMQAPQPPPKRRRERARTGSVEDVPTYDAEPSYDELELEEEEEAERARARPRPKSSETLIPSDVWEEIAGLMTTAQHRQSPKSKPASRSSRSVPAPRPASPSRPRRPARPARRAGPPRPVEPARSLPTEVSHGRAAMPGERVHLSHKEYGTDPSNRSRSEQDGLDPLARALGDDQATVRKQLRGRSRHALRQAVILQEVLGPPSALRPDRFAD